MWKLRSCRSIDCPGQTVNWHSCPLTAPHGSQISCGIRGSHSGVFRVQVSWSTAPSSWVTGSCTACPLKIQAPHSFEIPGTTNRATRRYIFNIFFVFVAAKGALTASQQPVTGTYHEPAESNPQVTAYFGKVSHSASWTWLTKQHECVFLSNLPWYPTELCSAWRLPVFARLSFWQLKKTNQWMLHGDIRRVHCAYHTERINALCPNI